MGYSPGGRRESDRTERLTHTILPYLAANGLTRCMWQLLPGPWIEPRPPALGASDLSHWTTWQVPTQNFRMGSYLERCLQTL